MSTWALIFILATGICGFTLKTPHNPLKGFITIKLFWVHLLLGITAIVLAVLALLS
ncbi:MAG: hypothetical protein QQM50_02940 [Dehalococcoides mccartyi]|jgi:hypothetical protein|uniref:Cytochrome b561 domain-containing protein n=2 Tax=root TaxID=1 RepID=A0AB38ZBP8_9CHLR|nr:MULTISPECIES: hypothetical protein [Dehalococcoides]AII59000.1 hypothetical protein X793_01175 [Dehalococcoides mccartyi CG4]MBF4482111.1 hypothetical protein [Dehalococcoides mccartyi]MBJ7531115.1 hypothetical protein [Dehalococcoides mccartyi]MCF7634733.1 hypothetical protein [Dehalococcoides mccartyi]MDP4279494.1 hypothetical protein [Dehalococcoides mccartyi]